MIDNVFENPDTIVDYAKTLRYYDLKNHPSEANSHWIGYRSDILGKINNVFAMKCFEEILNNTLNVSFGQHTSKLNVQYTFKANSFFHYMTEDEEYSDTRRHRDADTHVYAGIVYLSKNPKEHTGTQIYKENHRAEIENVFNRLVLYRADYIHSAMGGFGKTIEDARLTMNLFFNELGFRAVSKGNF